MRSELCSVDFDMRLSDQQLCVGEWRVETQESQRRAPTQQRLLWGCAHVLVSSVLVSAKLKCQVALATFSLFLALCLAFCLRCLLRADCGVSALWLVSLAAKPFKRSFHSISSARPRPSTSHLTFFFSFRRFLFY